MFTTRDHALSDSVSIILIISLILVLVMVMWSFFGGSAGVLKTNINIAESARDIDTGIGAHAIGLFHENGDPATLNATGSAGYHEVSFILTSPSGLTLSTPPSPAITDRVWQPGKSVYLYRDAAGFHVTDNLNARIAATAKEGPLVDLEGGIWTIRTVDTSVPVTINTVQVYVGGSGSSSSVNPYSPGILATYYTGQTWSVPATTNVASRIYFADTASGRTSDVSNWPNTYVGRTEDFSVKYEGLIRVNTEADYTFTLGSDDGSYMDLGSSSGFINNGGLHGYQEVSATRHLVPGYYPVTVRMYENTGQAVVYLYYQTPGMSSRQLVTDLWHVPSTPPTVDFAALPRVGTAPVTVRFTDLSVDATTYSWNFGDGSAASANRNPSHTYASGGTYTVSLTATNAFGSSTATKTEFISLGALSPDFMASYYRGQTWTTLAGTRTESQIQFTDQGGSPWPSDIVGRQEDFSVTWDGYLNVPAEADYSFRLTSDDGSYLWVDDVLVIDNGGLHSSRAYTGTTHLTAGYHHIVVKMYENTGQAVARLEYALPPSTTYNLVSGVFHVP
ncbi:MAG: PKD domain-containing protein [Methanomicrobiales archaeon]|nr:PKD domain-containing protein [Methanomicrobiales archaeon]